MNEALFGRVKQLLAVELGVDETEISPTSHLQEDLNADPLSVADLMVKIEEKFELKIPQDQTSRFITVEDIVDFISEQNGEI